MSKIPPNLKYTATHEWVRDDGDGNITVGITDHAQEQLGDIVFVELPTLSKKLSKGDEFAVIESVKAAADVYSPTAGEIAGTNAALNSTPELINKDPYGEGWLCKIRLQDTQGLSQLLSADDYAKQIEN
jgi:glycine cleavage system H protein